MAAARKGLGRGFESLIPTDLIDDSFDPNSPFDTTAQQDEQVSIGKTLPIDVIIANPEQPRRHFEQAALDELAASIQAHGVIQPIIVTPRGESYLIVAGERRFRASQIAGLTEIPVIIRTMTDQNQLEVSLIENIQRRDLNTIETAVAYAKLRDQFNLTNDAIAARVNKSTSAVINTMRLLKLPKEVVTLIAEGQLSEGQARPLIGHDTDLILKVVPKIISEEWSARKVEQYIVNLKESAKQAEVSKDETAAKYEADLAKLRDRLGAKVQLRTNTKGAGSLVIPFKDQADFERIRKMLG